MRRILQIAIAVTAVAAASVVPSAGAGPNHKNKYANDDSVTEQCDGGDITYVGPTKLWPPNHKYNTATVTAIDEDPDDNVTLVTTATHDQYDGEGEEVVGSGNTDEDIEPSAETEVMGTGSASQEFKMRAERSGTIKEGRTYTITADAVFTDSDGDGSSSEMSECHAEFTIQVPHDMRPSNR